VGWSWLSSCCYQPSMPWFYRQIPKSEMSREMMNIEVRICRDQHFNDEDLIVEQIEIYVH